MRIIRRSQHIRWIMKNSFTVYLSIILKDFILNQLEIKRKNIFRLFNRTVDSLDRSFQEAGAGAEVCVREQAV